ncbi:hypothetical protein BYT27DRAFT_7182393, partial [Phlegmacium glaucopus]
MSIGFISDFVRNTYDLPRSYLLVLIASLFFVSQLMLGNVTDISHLWIPSSLLGLSHGTLYSIYPTTCLGWFGMPHFYENYILRMECLQGLTCYVHAIYLTIGATFLSILLFAYGLAIESRRIRHDMLVEL